MLPESVLAECASDWLESVFDDLGQDSTAGEALAALQAFFPGIAGPAIDICDTGRVERVVGSKWGMHLDIVHGRYSSTGHILYHSRGGVCTCRDFAAAALPDPLAAPPLADSEGDNGASWPGHHLPLGTGRSAGPLTDDGPLGSGGLVPFCAHVLAVRIAEATGRLPRTEVDDARVVELLQQVGM